jgi:hypothetical protein
MITEDCVAFSLRPNAMQRTSTQKGHRVVHRPRRECFSDKEPCPGVARLGYWLGGAGSLFKQSIPMATHREGRAVGCRELKFDYRDADEGAWLLELLCRWARK